MKDQFASNSARNVVVNRWTRFLQMCLPATMGIFFVVMLVGCAEIGLFGSRQQSFTGKDSLLLQNPRSDILDVIAEVGKSMGYSVSALDKEANTVSLSSSSSMFTTFLIGKMSRTTFQISSKDRGKKLDIEVFVVGNFGTGGQEAAMKLINDFKAKLLEKIKQ